MFTIPKGSNPEWLVRSKKISPGKSRQKKLCYVWCWRAQDIKVLKEYYEDLLDFEKYASDSRSTSADRRSAMRDAANLRQKIHRHEREANARAAEDRKKMDRRRTRQLAHPPLKEPLKDWLARVTRVKTEALKLERELPPEQWDDFFRDAFLREFKPLNEIFERARRNSG